MEPRKASDVLLELEAKIDVLMSIVRTQDLNIKILSNKINTLIEKSDKLPIPVVPPPQPFKIEAVDTRETIRVSPEDTLPLEKEPKGFRRTSRPETFSGDDSYLRPPIATVQPKFPIQVPKMVNPEVVVAQAAVQKFTELSPPEQKKSTVAPPQNTIPVMQRVVDKNGKSVFLAEVEILEGKTKQTVSKIKTNGVGKWQASLPVGQYSVFIRKRGSANSDKMEIIQEVMIDGSKSPLELQMVIIK